MSEKLTAECTRQQMASSCAGQPRRNALGAGTLTAGAHAVDGDVKGRLLVHLSHILDGVVHHLRQGRQGEQQGEQRKEGGKEAGVGLELQQAGAAQWWARRGAAVEHGAGAASKQRLDVGIM